MPIYTLMELLGWAVAGVLSLFLTQAFLFWFLSLFIPYPKRPENPHLHHYTCIITAYRNIIMCNPLVESILRNDYPGLEIIVVADSCTMEDYHMYGDNITVLEPKTNLGSKVKSLMFAVPHLKPETEGIIVMDPDNLAHPDFLFNINAYFHKGYDVVQGIRIAKNKNSTIARSDSLGEFYYNFTDRYVAFNIGSSATIAGSGMAVRKDLFLSFLQSKKVKSKLKGGPILGEDKMLQNYTVLNGGRIAFEPQAIIFDEKLISGKQVERQRTRWINTYFENIGDGFRLIWNGFTRFSWNSLVLGLVSIKPPLFILAGSAVIMAILGAFLDIRISVMLSLAMMIFGSFFIFAAWRSPHSKNVLKSVRGVPKFIWYQIRALSKTAKHRKDFLATENSQNISIDDMIDEK